jgi:hypothetical protein
MAPPGVVPYMVIRVGEPLNLIPYKGPTWKETHVRESMEGTNWIPRNVGTSGRDPVKVMTCRGPNGGDLLKGTAWTGPLDRARWKGHAVKNPV